MKIGNVRRVSTSIELIPSSLVILLMVLIVIWLANMLLVQFCTNPGWRGVWVPSRDHVLSGSSRNITLIATAKKTKTVQEVKGHPSSSRDRQFPKDLRNFKTGINLVKKLSFKISWNHPTCCWWKNSGEPVEVPETSSTMGDSLYQLVGQISFTMPMLRGLMGNLGAINHPLLLGHDVTRFRSQRTLQCWSNRKRVSAWTSLKRWPIACRCDFGSKKWVGVKKKQPPQIH